ncbi:MAG TPA: hypothetical protein VG962_13235 [Steroidobacteraceae bacterium]|nr:hypothetical protein [Steroidobacteraceae bacterium]
MTIPVNNWWHFLRVVAVMNCVAWFVSAVLLARHRSNYHSDEYRRRRWLMVLSAGYVLGCAFRSFLPRIDLLRICLAQSWLSRMPVGRSVATIAELCFMAQCALLLHIAGRSVGNKSTTRISQCLMPLIIVAECASWYAILSTNYLGHVVENSIWTVCAALLFVSFFHLWPHSNRGQRQFLSAMMVFGIGYILFMITTNLPMYWTRWQLQLTTRHAILPLLQGLADASRRCIVSFNQDIWYQEMPWMTLYFTIVVWLSMLLPHAPTWIRNSRSRSAASLENSPPGE